MNKDFNSLKLNLEQIPHCQEMKGKYINNVECVADLRTCQSLNIRRKRVG